MTHHIDTLLKWLPFALQQINHASMEQVILLDTGSCQFRIWRGAVMFHGHYLMLEWRNDDQDCWRALGQYREWQHPDILSEVAGNRTWLEESILAGMSTRTRFETVMPWDVGRDISHILLGSLARLSGQRNTGICVMDRYHVEQDSLVGIQRKDDETGYLVQE